MKNNKPYQALLETEQGKALYELIDYVGGRERLIDELGVEPYILNNWIHIWKQCSPQGAVLIQDKIAGKFRKGYMRPDITDWDKALKRRDWFAELRKTSQGRALIFIIQKAGGRQKFAILMGVGPGVIDCWVQRGCVPVKRAQGCADLLGVDVSLVRPDKFAGITP